ncbi:glycosyltransferase [Pseudolysobacter antarcticus]|uniref:Glycosyltransferase n=1 Tax=Pseudolysobacter antarcticus TaxID=2511995 RepID=A0A411HGD3_9GAMM|nr:glycosyltransferase family 4 protein [Pseudolysobacter antarcticus]QBB69586.1 glycosyltransferase [Pseudolysobacter antarcticus]
MTSTSYPADLGDWRGLFIRHLVESLARRTDIKLRLWSPPGELPQNVEYAATPADSDWLKTLMAAGGIAHLMRTGAIRGLAAPLKLLNMLHGLYRRESGIDVYHVNWLQNTLVLPHNNLPLLTTVLGTDMQLLKLPGMTHLLRRVFRGRPVAICPNAQWMAPHLQRMFGDLATIHFVPFGIEPRWFDIERKPADPAKWLCVSRLTRGKIGTLFDWCEPFFNNGNRELHLFGPMQQSMPVPDWVHYHGPATPESLCSNWFAQAKGLISLSQHAEGRPQVMLEAMAAGLPIIASRIPAHEDMLVHKHTGWLCAAAADVGEAVEALDAKSMNIEIGAAAKLCARTEIGTWDNCAQRYADVYQTLIPACP